MKISDLYIKTDEVIKVTRDALQTVYDSLNNGQKK